MAERPPTTDAGVDPVLARIEARWSAERTERNLTLTLERLRGGRAGGGAHSFRWWRRLRRRAAH